MRNQLSTNHWYLRIYKKNNFTPTADDRFLKNILSNDAYLENIAKISKNKKYIYFVMNIRFFFIVTRMSYKHSWVQHIRVVAFIFGRAHSGRCNWRVKFKFRSCSFQSLSLSQERVESYPSPIYRLNSRTDSALQPWSTTNLEKGQTFK